MNSSSLCKSNPKLKGPKVAEKLGCPLRLLNPAKWIIGPGIYGFEPTEYLLKALKNRGDIKAGRISQLFVI